MKDLWQFQGSFFNLKYAKLHNSVLTRYRQKNIGKLQVVAVKLAIFGYFCPIQKVKIRQ